MLTTENVRLSLLYKGEEEITRNTVAGSLWISNNNELYCKLVDGFYIRVDEPLVNYFKLEERGDNWWLIELDPKDFDKQTDNMLHFRMEIRVHHLWVIIPDGSPNPFRLEDGELSIKL